MFVTRRNWCYGTPYCHRSSTFYPIIHMNLAVYCHNFFSSDLVKASEAVSTKYISLNTKEESPMFKSNLGKGVQNTRVFLSMSQNQKVENVIQQLQIDQNCNKRKLSEGLVANLLWKFGDDWKSALDFFRWASTQPGYTHNADAYNKMVNLLGKMKKMNTMWELVNEMNVKSLVNTETISMIMRRLAGAGNWEDAIKTFDGLESMRLRKDTETMNILLGALCKEYKVEIAREIFLKLKAYIPPDAYTFNIFVHGWCKVKMIDEAEWTILEMKGYGFQPSVITYSTILHTYCNQYNFQKAYELLDKMESDGYPPNVVTYTGILHKLDASEDVDLVFELTKRMKSAGVRPDIIYYNCLIKILGRAGCLVEAFHIYNFEMSRNGVAPNLSTFNTLISVSCHNSLEENALDFLKDLQLSPYKPDLLTYTPILKLYFRMGKTGDELYNLFDVMTKKHNLSLDSDTYTLFIHGFIGAGKIESAVLLFEEMIELEIPLRKRTYRLLKEDAESKGLYRSIEKIDDLMKTKKSLIQI